MCVFLNLSLCLCLPCYNLQEELSNSQEGIGKETKVKTKSQIFSGYTEVSFVKVLLRVTVDGALGI